MYSDNMHTVEPKNVYTGPGKLAIRLKEAGWTIEDKLETMCIRRKAMVSKTNLDSYSTSISALHGIGTKDCTTSWRYW